MTKDELQAWLQSRTDQTGACLLWNRAVNSAGYPVASVAGKRSRALRPFVFEIMSDRPVPKGKRLVMTCQNDTCVNHRHMKPLTVAQINHRLAADGVYRDPVRRARARAAARKSSPYSLEVAREVRRLRAEKKTLAEIEKLTGVPPSTASAIYRGKRWAEGISVFHR